VKHVLSEFLAGLRDVSAILVGVAPFGMIYGTLALGAGLPVTEAQAMSSVVFAGSAQFMMVQLFASATPPLVIVMVAFVVNLRHALYSASIAPHLKYLSPVWRAGLAYLLTDEAYAVTITRFENKQGTGWQHWYFLGAGLGLWTTWQLSTAAGIFLGAQIPASWSLDFSIVVTFIALMVPALKDRSGVFSALVAGIVAVLAYGLPYKLGIIVASLAGIAAGLWAEVRR
jgi:4-azaleucine resistance transporter AzlC